jgi:hypothetical protein
MGLLKRRRMRRELAIKKGRGIPSGHPENLAGADRASRRRYFRKRRQELESAGIELASIYMEEMSRRHGQ